MISVQALQFPEHKCYNIKTYVQVPSSAMQMSGHAVRSSAGATVTQQLPANANMG
jgi:hypothetical protein